MSEDLKNTLLVLVVFLLFIIGLILLTIAAVAFGLIGAPQG